MTEQRQLKPNFDIKICMEFDEETISYAIGTKFPVDRQGEAFKSAKACNADDVARLGGPKDTFWSLYKQAIPNDEASWEVVADYFLEEHIIQAAKELGGFET